MSWFYQAFCCRPTLTAVYAHRQYYCARSANRAPVQLTAVYVHHNKIRYSDVRSLSLHSVVPVSPVLIAQLNAPATINIRFPESRCSWTSIFGFSFFVVASLKTFNRNFVTCFDETGPIAVPQPAATSQITVRLIRPYLLPMPFKQHTFSGISRNLWSKCICILYSK